MKKLFALGCVLFLFSVQICFAQTDVTADINGKIGVGFYGGGFFPDGTEFFGEDIDVGKTGTYGGSITWGVNRFFALEVSADRNEPEVDSTLLNINYGECRTVPLILTMQFRYVGKAPEYYDNMAVYFLGGVGYYFNSYNVSKELKQYWANQGYNVTIDMEDGFGFHVGLGVEAFLTENLALNLEVRRHWADADIKETLTSIENPNYAITLKDDVDLNFTQVILGFKLYFSIF